MNDSVVSDSAPGFTREDLLAGKPEVKHSSASPSILSVTDIFSLSDAAATVGSPCVVIKDSFLGRERALRVLEGMSSVGGGLGTLPTKRTSVVCLLKVEESSSRISFHVGLDDHESEI